MKKTLIASALAFLMASSAHATDVEVLHWWTSPGEAAAVKEIADLFESKTGHKWVDGAIAGSGIVARPVMTSRILGGDPMAAMQFNHGEQAREMVEAGLLLDITDVAEAQGWKDKMTPDWFLEACVVEGRVYCAPLNFHGQEWMYTSLAAFKKAGIEPVTSWEELKQAAPKLREAGIIPLAAANQPSWLNLVFTALVHEVGGAELYRKIFVEGDEATLKGEQVAKLFAELAIARELSSGTNVVQWNLATTKLINAEAAVQIMGDWALGEFDIAGKVQGVDYDCFIGMKPGALLVGGGDAFYFPLNRDEAVTSAQKELAATLLSPEIQYAFNMKKGSLPVVKGVEMKEAGACVHKGADALAADGAVPDINLVLAPNTIGDIGDLTMQFFGSSMTADEAHTRFIDIMLNK